MDGYHWPPYYGGFGRPYIPTDPNVSPCLLLLDVHETVILYIAILHTF